MNYVHRKFRSGVIREVEHPDCPAIGKGVSPGESELGKVLDHESILHGWKVGSFQALRSGAAGNFSHGGKDQFLDTATQNAATHQPGIAAPFVGSFIEDDDRYHAIVPEAIG